MGQIKDNEGLFFLSFTLYILVGSVDGRLIAACTAFGRVGL